MKYEPHPYQAYAKDFLLHTPFSALWLDMGLGKTIITLTAIQELMYDRFEVQKVLIIAPKKVAETTWQKEVKKWDHLQLLSCSTILGSEKKRIRAINAPASIYIINRENVCWLVENYKYNWPFDMIVIDEASSFKNHQAKRFKALRMIRPKLRRLVELTGTPSPNGLIDLWAQIYLIDQGQRLGKGIGYFREHWFLPDKRNREQIFTYKPKDGAEVDIKEALSDVVISMKSEDYLDLPDVINIDVPVILSPEARKSYDTIEQTMLLQVDEETIIEATTRASLYNKLLQLANGAVYNEEHVAVEVHDCKLEALRELVESLNGQHALLFYSFRHDIPRIYAALKSLGLRIEEYKGPQQEEDWNAGKIDILLTHPASTAYGLNLQYGGHHIVWFGKNPSLELTLQANKRLHRQGQKEPVIIHNLIVENSSEEDVVKSLEDKDNMETALINSLKVRIEQAKKRAGV
ncbi:MAG: DEAD/DEAH box helicase [Huintestinicola sp.]